MHPNETPPLSPPGEEPEDPLMKLLDVLERLDRRTESLSTLPEAVRTLNESLERWQRSNPPATPDLTALLEGQSERLREQISSMIALIAQQTSALASQRPPGVEQPLSSNEELLGELRMLWRKQELYVVGLRGSLQTDLEAAGQTLRGQIREDLQGRFETSTQAIAAAVRQATSSARSSRTPQPSEPTPPPRPPLIGVVVLSSVTSALSSALMWWLLT